MDKTTQKTSYFLTTEAIAAIEKYADSPHKRGEWLSAAALYYAKIFEKDVEGIGLLEQHAALLARIDHKLDLLLAKK